MIGIPHELAAIGGLAVIGLIGERALAKSGQSDLAQYISIIVSIAGGIVVYRFALRGIRDALEWAFSQ